MASAQKLLRLCRITCLSKQSQLLSGRILPRYHSSCIQKCVVNGNASEKTISVKPLYQVLQKRNYAGPQPLDRQSIGKRILLVLKLYDKVDPEKLTLDSRFKEDLSLDSLDRVEVILALEDEFGFEIPDQDADYLTTPAMAVQYIMDKLDVLDEAHH